MEGTIAEIRLFAGTFPPRGWAFCQGQIISIATNTALFSILGTTYGGNGQTTFALPDLRGRAAMGTGGGPGLSQRTLGEVTGSETNTLVVTNIPAHIHAVTGNLVMEGTAANGNADLPQNTYPAKLAGTNMYSTTTDGSFLPDMLVNMTTGNTGSGLPYNNIQPVLALNFIIALEGVFPSRN